MAKLENTFLWGNPVNRANLQDLERRIAQLEALLVNAANIAYTNRTNNFVQPQQITVPDSAMQFIQNHNASFISFDKLNGDRRGYIGIGRGNLDIVDIWGKNGIRLLSLNDDIELVPARRINFSNKPTINVPNPAEDSSVIPLSYVKNTRTVYGTFRNVVNGTTREWNLPAPASSIVSMVDISKAFRNARVIRNGRSIELTAGADSPLSEVYITYIVQP